MAFLMDERDGVSVMIVNGDLDRANCGDLVLAAEKMDPCVLDCSGVTFMDSVALSGLLGLAGGRPVRLVAPSETMTTLLRRTGTATFFEMA